MRTGINFSLFSLSRGESAATNRGKNRRALLEINRDRYSHLDRYGDGLIAICAGSNVVGGATLRASGSITTLTPSLDRVVLPAKITAVTAPVTKIRTWAHMKMSFDSERESHVRQWENSRQNPQDSTFPGYFPRLLIMSAYIAITQLPISGNYHQAKMELVEFKLTMSQNECLTVPARHQSAFRKQCSSLKFGDWFSSPDLPPVCALVPLEEILDPANTKMVQLMNGGQYSSFRFHFSDRS